jgi:hypothetical protein
MYATASRIRWNTWVHHRIVASLFPAHLPIRSHKEQGRSLLFALMSKVLVQIPSPYTRPSHVRVYYAAQKVKSLRADSRRHC